ncbi:MAG TPA: hypothetical protein VGF82_22585 [Terracidiphilus sp.]|jgi:hypothetical protein
MAGNAVMRESANSAAPNVQQTTPAAPAARGRAAGQATRGVGRGISGFLKPFRSVGGKILLEVVGVFFLLPALVFMPVMWRARESWQHGPDHRTFVASALVIAVFLYLGLSSFWRARHRS